MKRFLIFVIICIVSLGLGFTVFRFMSYDEIISVTQTVFEVNVGDTITLDVETEHLKSGTTITTAIEANGGVIQKGIDDFTFIATSGGQTYITVNSNSKGFIPVRVQVTVGSGVSTSPFFVKSADDLKRIGASTEDSLPANAYYKLTADINLTGENWQPLTNIDASTSVDSGFSGEFNMNGYTIRNMNISSATTANAGLFGKIAENGKVYNGTFEACSISGQFDNTGIVAGENKGYIENVAIINSNVRNEKANAFVGGLVGTNTGSVYKSQVASTTISATGTGSVAGGLVGFAQTSSSLRASITLSSAKAIVAGDYAVGGLVGKASGAIIENCFAGEINSDAKIQSTNQSAYVGGVVGVLESATVGSATYISALKDTYSVISFDTASANKGAIIGVNNNPANDKNKIYGNYYNSQTSGVDKAVANQVDPTNPEASDFGVFNKSLDELQNDSATYYSFVNGDNTYYWDFENIWILNAGQNKMPSINFDAKFISSNLDLAQTKGSISSVEQLKSIADSADKFTLTSSFTIDTTDSYTPINFNGILVGELNPDGTPKHTITLKITTNNGLTSENYAALFATLGKNAVVQNIAVNVLVENANAQYVGAIAAINEGKILNCKVSGSITTITTQGDVYLGGVVAENRGTIQSTTSSVAISISTAPKCYFVGGIAGLNNNGAVIDSSTNSGAISLSSVGAGYVGGIAGQSNDKIVYSLNKGSIVSAIRAENLYVGGVVGYVNNSITTTSGNIAEQLRATNVGGVVGFTTGYITECYSKSTITGDYVGGIVCVATQNYLSDCASYNHLVGESENSILNGVGYQFTTKNKQSYAVHMFSACTFGIGEKYYESISDVRGGDDVFALYELCLESSIYVSDIAEAERSIMPMEWLINIFYEDKWLDNPVTDEQARGSDGFAEFTKQGFSTSIWSMTEGEYPALVNAAR